MFLVLLVSIFLNALQVAGHCSIFKLDGMVCKPLIPRECEFYQTIYREFPPLVPLTPEFHGSITIHNHTTQDAQASTSNDLTIYHNPPSPKSSTDALQSPTSSPNMNSYIVLEDLTAGMSKPCAMDMKVCQSIVRKISFAHSCICDVERGRNIKSYMSYMSYSRGIVNVWFCR